MAAILSRERWVKRITIQPEYPNVYIFIIQIYLLPVLYNAYTGEHNAGRKNVLALFFVL